MLVCRVRAVLGPDRPGCGRCVLELNGRKVKVAGAERSGAASSVDICLLSLCDSPPFRPQFNHLLSVL